MRAFIRLGWPWLLATTFIITSLIIALAQGSVRESIVIPLLTLLWLMQRVFESLPQGVIWLVLVLIVIVMSVRSMPISADRIRRYTYTPDSRGRVEEWAVKLIRARSDAYVRWQVANRLAQTTIRTIATNERIEQRTARRRLEAGEFALPPHVQAYLLAGLNAYEPPRRTWFPFRTFARQPGPLEADLDTILPHLEKFLV
jgi:hypothetical protein